MLKLTLINPYAALPGSSVLVNPLTIQCVYATERTRYTKKPDDHVGTFTGSSEKITVTVISFGSETEHDSGAINVHESVEEIEKMLERIFQ